MNDVRIALVYNAKPVEDAPHGAAAPGAPGVPDVPDDLYEEYDRPETIAQLCAAIAAGGGHEVVAEPYGPDLGGRLRAGGYALVFNIAEGSGGRDREAHVPALCALLGIPYTGSDALTMAVTLDKWVCRRVVSPDVTVAAGVLVRGPDDAEGLRAAARILPAIVKPNDEGSSKGIRGDPVARDEAGLRARVAELWSRYGRPALVEEFVAGTEITVGVLGNDPPAVLGVMEVVPVGPEAGKGADFVYTLDVKRDWRNRVRYRVPAALPAEVLERVAVAALSAYRSVGARDLARIDFRVRASGEPVFLEMNPLPGLDPVSGDIVILARGMGIEHDVLIQRVLQAALARTERERATAAAPAAGAAARLRVAVVQSPPPPALPGQRVRAEMDLSDAAAALTGAIRALGHTPVALCVAGGPADLLAALRAEAADVVFNLLEAPSGRADLETAAAGLLEWSGIPMTGNDADTLARLRHKGAVRALLAAAGVPVAAGRLFVPGAGPAGESGDLRAILPAFVKPACEDGSVGIGPDALCPDADAVAARVGALFADGHSAVVVEAFLPGREFNVLVTGGAEPEELFIGEVMYRLPPGAPPFQTYGSKWRPDDPGYSGISTVHPAAVDEPLAAQLRAIARRAWAVCGCHGYARVDLRCDAAGAPHVLEVNPNPDLAPDAGTQRSLRGHGVSLAAFVEQQIRLARARAARAGRPHAR